MTTGLLSTPAVFFQTKQGLDGASPDFVIPVTNTSPTQTIQVSGITATDFETGETQPAFNVSTTCTTVAPGGNCTITISATTESLCELQEAVVTLNSNDTAGPLVSQVDVYGTDTGFNITNLVNSGITPTQLAQSLVGEGVTISNVKYTGADVAAGTFSSEANIIGFTDGIILSTGSVRSIIGPNCDSGITAENNTAGDPDLDVILGAPENFSQDAAVLEFDFVPKSSTITFSYVFASDEYNEFVGQFNDVFAFFVNGNNIALLPGVTPPTPVSINTVNEGANSQFFRNNDDQAPTPIDTEMDGLTTVLTATAQVTANQTNHIKLAIADANDTDVDSNVFIQAGSFSSGTVQLTPTSVPFGNQPVGTTSAAQPITAKNVGNATVNITSVVASAGFGETDNCVGALAAGATCTIQATFSPTSATVFNGTIMLNDDAADSPQSVAVSGTGTSSSVTLVSLAVTPSTATVAVGGTQQFTATGTFSDGSTKDLTTQSSWRESSDGEIANIDEETGRATGVAVGGPVTITAVAIGTEVSGTAQLTVSNVPIHITVTPPATGGFGPVSPGGNLPVGIVLIADPGFSGTVTFGCSVTTAEGAPAPSITCVPNPASVNITPGGPLQVAIVITTFCKGLVAPLGGTPGGLGGGLALLLLSTMFAGTVWMYRRNPRWALSFALFVLIALGGVGMQLSAPRCGWSNAGRKLHADDHRNRERTNRSGRSDSLHRQLEANGSAIRIRQECARVPSRA